MKKLDIKALKTVNGGTSKHGGHGHGHGHGGHGHKKSGRC